MYKVILKTFSMLKVRKMDDVIFYVLRFQGALCA